MQIAVEAMMLIGANHRTILWSVLVVSEQMMPKITRIATDNKQICMAVLAEFNNFVQYERCMRTYGENA